MGLRPERRWNDGLTKEESIRACVPSHLAYEVERGGNEPSEAFGQCQTGMVPCLQPLSVKHPVAIADPLLHLLHCAILKANPLRFRERSIMLPAFREPHPSLGPPGRQEFVP
jgi:hypothetical protein